MQDANNSIAYLQNCHAIGVYMLRSPTFQKGYVKYKFLVLDLAIKTVGSRPWWTSFGPIQKNASPSLVRLPSSMMWAERRCTPGRPDLSNNPSRQCRKINAETQQASRQITSRGRKENWREWSRRGFDAAINLGSLPLAHGFRNVSRVFVFTDPSFLLSIPYMAASILAQHISKQLECQTHPSYCVNTNAFSLYSSSSILS